MSQLRLNPNIQDFVRSERPESESNLERKTQADKLYQLANNENPLGPSPRVVEAINAVAPTLSYYPNYSDIELRRAIAEVLGRGLTPAHIYTGCSGFESLELIARGFLGPGDEMILSSPTFVGAYSKVSLPLGANVVDIPLEPDTFRYRAGAVLNAINDKTKMIMLCNPNNPTGTVIGAEAMDQLMRHLPDHVLIVADEVYHHFVEDDDYPDSLQYVLDEKNIVVVHSFSKAYGLAGMRLGYGIAKPEIADYLAGLHRGFHQNKLSLAAGIAACGDQAHVQYVVNYLRGEARWVCQQFDRLAIKYWKPAANFILFETRMLAETLNQQLLERGFLLRTQTRSNMPYGMRLSLGTREANTAFIAALEAILSDSDL